jgi:hypothetical protein
MASTSYIYAKAKSGYADPSGTTGEFDWANDTIKGALVSSSYVPDYDNHAYYAQITGTNNILMTASLAGKTFPKVGSGATAQYACKSNMISFTGSVSARGMVLFKDTGNVATSPLFAYVLLDNTPADVSSSVGIEVTPNATNGWILVG